MRNIFLCCVLYISHLGCNKKVDPCAGKPQPRAEFAIREIVGDTAFDADTVFRDNYVAFGSLLSYSAVTWKIGNGPGQFSSSDFTLSFHSTLENVLVNFTARNPPNTTCFPDDSGIYSGTKLLVPVEQFDKSVLTKSPLVGRYKGYFTDKPEDTFTVRIEYFDSTKYDVSVTGTKNFYWISNIPNGFIDSTSEAARQYPELRNGVRPDMGYKSFVFQYADCPAGKGWLSNDTLHINYGNSACGRKHFIGKRE